MLLFRIYWTLKHAPVMQFFIWPKVLILYSKYNIKST